MLSESGCPYIWKGGSCLMLLLGSGLHRLSIDVDIVCPPGTNIEQYLAKFPEYGFTGRETIEREQRFSSVPKSHEKLHYKVAYLSQTERTESILLDVLYEYAQYEKVETKDIKSPFILLDGAPLTVKVPSVDDILADKLTAFAPNTSGIPYFKNGKPKFVEIMELREDDYLQGGPQGFGGILRCQLLQHPEGTGLVRGLRVGLRLQQPFQGGPAAVRKYSNEKALRPSADTLEITAAAMELVERIYRPGILFKKSGVILSDIVPGCCHHILFDTVERREERVELSETLDRMNQKYGIRTVGLAVAGSDSEAWKNKKEHLTPNYLTDIDQIMTVRI
ncbi:MAG: nucleotidyl transferase AbiEii/AbiGii toxin family protein [Rikenellaceae bacterium]|nr:nucleotidyl transferase AbiEii/AbiGii toxin family protein [Rikenellaceae bacterium]